MNKTSLLKHYANKNNSILTNIQHGANKSQSIVIMQTLAASDYKPRSQIDT
jgi:hypothetical protein